ncbi:hypothetical protein Vadar_024488 [Vaccinium darrowii]|uniref:Uncharacterized protein n=1 Tax=Vaccinium darrowii TaxID=229202 RepID=A0ACB7XU93_9ERIC|nr:hypothetical protein Vadar_024488 [Vaccinium darrowii]
MFYSAFFSLAARYTVRSFGIRRNEKIACYVTVRSEKAMQLVESGLKFSLFKKHAIKVISGYDANRDSMAVVSHNCCHSLSLYDDCLSFLFRYDPSTGIYGMDSYVVLEARDIALDIVVSASLVLEFSTWSQRMTP